MKAFAAWTFASASVFLVSGCGYFFGPGGHYARRDKNCVVSTLTTAPKEAVDDLGLIKIDCWAGNNDGCEQELLDEVCRRGGNIVWGMGDPGASSSTISAHVARTRSGPRGSE
jgi:hypothetical protein